MMHANVSHQKVTFHSQTVKIHLRDTTNITTEYA